MIIQLPVAVAFPSLPRSLPVLETFLHLLCLACHYRLVGRVSLRRPLVASRTSLFPLQVHRDSQPFRLPVPGSPRVLVLAPQWLRGKRALVAHHRCQRLRVHLRVLLCRVLRGRLRVLVMVGSRKVVFTVFYNVSISYT